MNTWYIPMDYDEKSNGGLLPEMGLDQGKLFLVLMQTTFVADPTKFKVYVLCRQQLCPLVSKVYLVVLIVICHIACHSSRTLIWSMTWADNTRGVCLALTSTWSTVRDNVTFLLFVVYCLLCTVLYATVARILQEWCTAVTYPDFQ